MAVTFHEVGSTKAMFPLKYIAKMYVDQTLTQLVHNLSVQHVWPTEIYPGFHITNEFRRERAGDDHSKGWFADGEGAKSFEGEVIRADEDTGMVELRFRHADYLQYVDIGVGAGRKAEDVDRSRKVRFKSRYTQWKPSAGKSHRPAIMPEMRHLATRLQDYAMEFYGTKFEYDVYETFEGLTINL